nr:MAG TPA: Protein of unknown function (DUF1043) [Caudoviricetes sp.]
MTNAGFVAIGILIGLIGGYFLGAIRQAQGKDSFIKKLIK